MDIGLILLAVVFLVGALVALAVLFDIPIPGFSSSSLEVKGNIKNLVAAQRGTTSRDEGKGYNTAKQNNLYETAEETKTVKRTDSKLTLRKRLKFARWELSPLIFHLIECGVSLPVLGLISGVGFHYAIQGLSLLSGPIFVRWLLNMMVDRRFKAFDADYPAFLSSVVSLLKTGMNTMAALEAAAQGLEDGSLVRQEVELMVERLRFGVSEDRSIGSFGEDVYHPEIELFVQALLLSRRVGGTLSDTLDRLSRQVRRRQYFRQSAVAAVSMQRGSIWFILGILVSMLLYLLKAFPEAVIGPLKDPTGWVIWQVCVVVILFGIFWVRQVTKIRI